MNKNSCVCLLAILGLLITGCNSGPYKTNYDITTMSKSDLETLMSRELTVDTLVKKLGEPDEKHIRENRGYLFYGSDAQQKSIFRVTGNYIIAVHRGDVYIKGVTPRIFTLRAYNQYGSSQNPGILWLSGFWVDDKKFESYADLKKFLLKLPENSVLQYNRSCFIKMVDKPIKPSVSIEDIKRLCNDNGILFVQLMSG